MCRIDSISLSLRSICFSSRNQPQGLTTFQWVSPASDGSSTTARISDSTLASYAVEASDLPDETAKKLPRHPTTPATLLGRLARAVDQPGLGSLLLADALGRILANTREVASALVVVDAKDDSAEAFYRKHGFIPFGGCARKLFLPMKTIAEAVQRSAR